jgi:hypothetical protein
MIDSNKLWSSVGSAGIVDPADIGKVVFAGPVAQMPGVVLAPPQTAATAAVPSPTKAVIRYPVTPVDGVVAMDSPLEGDGFEPSVPHAKGSVFLAVGEELGALCLRQGGLARGGNGGRARRRLTQRAGRDTGQIRPRDRRRRAGEIRQPVWYRFSFKIAGDWPQDVPAAGRQPCRTVIHQIKQDSFKDGKSCSASPFFKIEEVPSPNR